jgi:hypothetical protein
VAEEDESKSNKLLLMHSPATRHLTPDRAHTSSPVPQVRNYILLISPSLSFQAPQFWSTQGGKPRRLSQQQQEFNDSASVSSRSSHVSSTRVS